MSVGRSPWPFPTTTTCSGTAQYDFLPFMSAPAVVERVKEAGGVMRPIHIPGSPIPSPLARNLSPDQLVGLKEFLVGRGPETSSPTVNSHEIWLSWKRAWDIWNNNYIHGRVNPIWVRQEFERIQRLDGDDDFGGDCEMSDEGITRWENKGSEASEPDSEGDSFSGGFRALKDFPEFKGPPPVDPEIGDDGIIWDDLINNSVWRPRRVGDETAKIELDIDPDEFLRTSDLERDRGVDCGRLPFPVLRPLIQYVQLGDGAFIKKKVWDGVIRTVFNMPTQPLEPNQSPEEERLERVGEMFGDSYRDFNPISANQDIFPLDIRRIRRVHPPPIPNDIPPLLENRGDVLLYDRHALVNESPFKYRNMSKEDPWYVSKEQKALIDNPPRRYPPPEQKYKPDMIPIDDTIFRGEFDSDQLNLTRYFVTNLHGGTLIINGVEVQKGQVAGPLPKFAVIECPGGQIAFWFGSYGRNHLAGSYGSSPAKWLALRQRTGWKYTGLSAGQVWKAKIKDRIDRKKVGDNEHDDELWEEWLSAKRLGESSIPTSVTYQLPLPGLRQDEQLPLPDNIAQPHVIFPSEQDELAWMTAQRVYEINQGDAMDIDMVPGEEQFFSGSKNLLDYIKGKVLTQKKVDDVWVPVREYQQELQQVLIDNIRDEEGEQTRVEEERSASFRALSKKEKVLESRPKKLRTIAETVQYREEELDRELQQGLEQDPALELGQEEHLQMQREWNKYTTRARQIWRKRMEEEMWQDEEFQVEKDKQRKTPRKPKVILHHNPKPDDHPPNFDDKSGNNDLSGRQEEEEKLLAAIEKSKKEYRDNTEQAFIQNAIAEYKSVPEFLEEHGFSNMEEYLNAVTASKQQDLQSYLKTLKKAYREGAKARARLLSITLEQYTTYRTNMSPDAYTDFSVRQTNVTEDNIPHRITNQTNRAEEAIARAKWSTLCDLVIEANDFESQTKAASGLLKTHTTADGKSFAVI